MNANLITDIASATQSGQMSFPEAVKNLLEAGAEYYQVDYVRLRMRYYSASGQMVATSLLFEGLPPVAPELDKERLRAAIFDSQRNGQSYREFSRRAMEAGVQGYFVFLRGQRVVYLGRTGDLHTEWFPGTKPSKAGS
jgi:uncharacterized protein YbcV (DUF1398 family)